MVPQVPILDSCACLAITANAAAVEVKGFLDSFFRKDVVNPIALLLYLGAFIANVVLLAWLRGNLWPRTRFLHKNESPEKRKHLIAFVSNLIGKIGPDGSPERFTPTNSLDDDIKLLTFNKEEHKIRWSWEMLFRGVKYHLDELETVTLLCSKESIVQVHLLKAFLDRYGALSKVKVNVFVNRSDDPLQLCRETYRETDGWDFEDFDGLSRAMNRLLRILNARKIRDEEIMIDFTGGLKVASVVAASATFNRALKAQYVQTNDPYGVIGYDYILEDGKTPGMS